MKRPDYNDLDSCLACVNDSARLSRDDCNIVINRLGRAVRDLRDVVKGGPCETCQHCAQRTAGGNECSKTLRDITIEIDGERNSFAAFAGCAELGNGCWAWKAKR